MTGRRRRKLNIRHTASSIDIRYIDQDRQEHSVKVRTSWQMDSKLREIIAAGFTPLTINGEPAYNPNDLQIAIRYLEVIGCRVTHCGLLDYMVYTPWTEREHAMRPDKIIEGALKVRQWQLDRKDESE